MIRIAVVDDHPALRAGLETVLRCEPGLVPVGSAGDAFELWPLLATTQPDVVLLDYHLPTEDGLLLCRRIKRQPLAPQVLLYSAYAGSAMAIPAVLAGADGLIGKDLPAQELSGAIRLVAAGKRVLPPVRGELIAAAAKRLEPAELPVLAMALQHLSPAEICDRLHLEPATLAGQVDAMISRLRVDVPTPSSVDRG